ncbi:hypothetical protein KM043_009242 [Ampulex compressa]|nr:hypothetical protein KM043_009242 [Ampulex compressa]
MFMRHSAKTICKTVLMQNVTLREAHTCGIVRLIQKAHNGSLSNRVLLDTRRHSNVFGVHSFRYASTKEPVEETLWIDQIPEPPTVVQEVAETIVQLHPNGEQTLASLGISGYSPSALLQQGLEYIHITYDIPWWGTIVLGTICARICTFPLMVICRRNSNRMHNVMPKVSELQRKMSEARDCANEYEAALYAQRLYKYLGENGVSNFKAVSATLGQAPVFLSFYIGLKNMANIPVQSLTHGGLWWFTDLTLPDPLYLLPFMTCVTQAITLKVGADFNTDSVMNKYGKILVYALPVMIFPFLLSSPAAVLCYWTSTNVISLVQVSLFQIKAFRKVLKIPERVVHAPDAAETTKKNFVEGIQESWLNMKLSKQLADRKRANEVFFNKAGRAPLQKTYKYDPTKKINH